MPHRLTKKKKKLALDSVGYQQSAAASSVSSMVIPRHKGTQQNKSIRADSSVHFIPGRLEDASTHTQNKTAFIAFRDDSYSHSSTVSLGYRKSHSTYVTRANKNMKYDRQLPVFHENNTSFTSGIIQEQMRRAKARRKQMEHKLWLVFAF